MEITRWRIGAAAGGRHRWVPTVAAGVSAVMGIGVGAGVAAGQDRLAGLPGAALPGTVVLLTGAAMAVATTRRWGLALPRRLIAGWLWTVAAISLTGSCWLLLNLCQLVLQGTVSGRDGRSDWLTFGERLGLTSVGALFVATALAWRRTVACVHCRKVHALAVTAAPPRPASRRIRVIAYAGCLAWLPYAGGHTLGALGVPGIEPGGDRPSPDMAIALWIGIGLSIFLLLGLVSPWGQVFPRWAPPLTGRRVPRLLPIVPVWLIAPTFVLYGLGSGVFVVLLACGVVSWHGDHGDTGLIGFAEPISFAGYGLALTIAAISYQMRTRPVPTGTACPIDAARDDLDTYPDATRDADPHIDRRRPARPE